MLTETPGAVRETREKQQTGDVNHSLYKLAITRSRNCVGNHLHYEIWPAEPTPLLTSVHSNRQVMPSGRFV